MTYEDAYLVWKIPRNVVSQAVVGKMTTFDLWPIPLGGGAWGAGQICDIMRPQLAMNRFLPLWPHRFPHFGYIHLGGGGVGGSDIRSMSSIRPICKCRCPPLLSGEEGGAGAGAEPGEGWGGAAGPLPEGPDPLPGDGEGAGGQDLLPGPDQGQPPEVHQVFLAFTVLQVYSVLASKRNSFSVSFHGATDLQCTCIKNRIRFGWYDSSMGAHAIKHKSPFRYAYNQWCGSALVVSLRNRIRIQLFLSRSRSGSDFWVTKSWIFTWKIYWI